MMRAPRRFASSTIWATSKRGIRSVTITISLTPASIASKTASFVNAGGTVTTEPSGTWPSSLAELLDGVEHGHAVHLAALAARRDAADDLRAVVEALARQVHGLAAGDALDDEGGVLVDQHQPWIFSTARFAASCIDTERSKYSIPYFSRILKPSSSQAPGIRKTATFSAGSWPELEARLDHAARDDVDAGVRDDRHHHGDLVDARLLEHELREVLRLRDATGCRRSRSSWPACRRSGGRRRRA